MTGSRTSDDVRAGANKTRAQLKREIAYFAGLATRTTSRDRIRLAHIAIAARERQLNGLEWPRGRTEER